jgi:hypothetical protein
MNIEDVVDFLCFGLPTRGSRKLDKGIDEWLFAETAAFAGFRNYFLGENPGALVINQLNYKTIESNRDPGLQFVLDALDVYFRNWWSPKNRSREGGARKPDGIGISQDGKLIEIIEVKPWYMHSDGSKQLDEMINIILDGLQSYYKEECMRSASSLSFNPDYIKVIASPWKPKKDAGLVVPLPDSAGTGEIAWICFKPTRRALPDGSFPRDGVILYEIHYFTKQNTLTYHIPEEVARRLAEAHAARVCTPALQLWPWATDYTRRNPSDAELILRLLGDLGAVVVVGLIAALLIDTAAPLIGLIGRAGELPTAVETVEVLVQNGGYRVPATLVRVSVAQYEAVESAEALKESARTAGRVYGIVTK